MTQRRWAVLLTTLVVLGAVFRLALYLRNYSFFLDECALALNLGTADWGALTRQLRYDQAAPVGFLLLENTLARWMGTGERVLRLIPLLSGMLSVAAMWWACRKKLSQPALAAVVALIAANHSLVAYSAQAKQYSVEVLAAVLAIGLCWPLFDDGVGARSFWTRVIAAGLLLWFSYSALFVLAGMLVALAAQAAFQKRSLWRVVGAAFVWLAITVPVFVFSMRGGLSNTALQAMWNADYLPWRTPAKWIPWTLAHGAELCILLFNQRLWVLAALAVFAGFWCAIRTAQWITLATVAALLACLGASALGVYPFHGRLLLFLIPGLAIAMVQGGEFIPQIVRAVRPVWTCVAIAALVWSIVSTARYSFFPGGYVDEPREALRLLQSEQLAGDEVYVTHLATPCFIYYRPRLNLQAHATLERDHPQDTPHGRQWLVAMRTPWEPHGEAIVAQEHFAARVHEVKRREAEWTSVVLYEPVAPR